MKPLSNSKLADFREKVLGFIAGVYDESDALHMYQHQMPEALDEIDRLKSRLAEEQAATAEQEKQMLGLMQEAGQWQEAAKNLLLHWTETGLVGSKAVDFLPQSEQMEAISEFKNAVKRLIPIDSQPICGGDCQTCEVGKGPLIELRADRVGFDSPEYAARIARVRTDIESLKSHNPNRRD